MTKPEDEPVSCGEKMKLFFVAHWRGVVTLVVPLIFIPVMLPYPPEKYQICLYCLCIMGVFWVSECIPLFVTSFLPVVIFPFTEVLSTAETVRAYMNDTLMVFLGSLFLAYAVEQSELHIRLALGAVRMIGYSHGKLLFAVCMVTMFISMWISNTAATTMMVPIVFAILKVFDDQKLLKIYEKSNTGDMEASDITSCYFCATSFSATIGGIGTLVGTVTNLVFKGLLHTFAPELTESLSFPKFSAFTVPLMLSLELSMYLYLMIVYFGLFRPGSKAAKDAEISPTGLAAAKETVESDYKKLGSLRFWEFMVILLFGSAMVLFFFRSPQMFTGWGDAITNLYGIKNMKFIQDSALAMAVSFLMFLLPSSTALILHFTKKYKEDLPKSRILPILRWPEVKTVMPFSFAFLLGGGFALSTSARITGLNQKIGQVMKALKPLPNSVILLLIIFIVTMVTNIASNVAIANIFCPIVMQLALEIGRNPMWYDLAAGLSASFCFLLPVGTPGNLIVQGAAKIPTGKMIKAGAGTTVATILLTWIFIVFWAPIIWPELKQTVSSNGTAPVP